MQHKKAFGTTLALAMSMAMATSAYAESGFSYRFSGFGTVGYAATDSSDVKLANPGQLKGAGEHGSALPDSRLGAQLDLTFNPRLSATVQAIAMQNTKGDFTPQVEWAFLRYKLSNSVTMRMGRLGWPAYLVSDYRYVGYANPWVRAPLEVYNLAPLDSFEGADLSWSHDVGSGYLTLQGLFGHAAAPMPQDSEQSSHLRVNQLTGAYVTYEIGSLRLRGGLSTSKVTYSADSLAQLLGGLQMAGFEDAAKAVAASNARTNFASVGGTYDSGSILATAEYGKLHSGSATIGTASGWYGTFGYRFNKWMPYVTWAGYSKQDHTADFAIPAIGPLLPLAEGVQGVARGNDQHTASIGVRIDVHNNVAVKLQADHVLPSQHGGTFIDVAPGYDGHAVNVYSAVVDFVF